MGISTNKRERNECILACFSHFISMIGPAIVNGTQTETNEEYAILALEPNLSKPTRKRSEKPINGSEQTDSLKENQKQRALMIPEATTKLATTTKKRPTLTPKTPLTIKTGRISSRAWESLVSSGRLNPAPKTPAKGAEPRENRHPKPKYRSRAQSLCRSGDSFPIESPNNSNQYLGSIRPTQLSIDF